jgi:hypothetical protein
LRQGQDAGQAFAAYVADILASLPPPFQSSIDLLQVLLPHPLLADAVSPTLALMSHLPSVRLREAVAGALAHVGSILGVQEWACAWKAVQQEQEQARKTHLRSTATAAVKTVPAEAEVYQGDVGADKEQDAMQASEAATDISNTLAPSSRAQTPVPSLGGAVQAVTTGQHASAMSLAGSPPHSTAISTLHRGPLYVAPHVARAVVDSIRQQEFGIGEWGACGGLLMEHIMHC